MHRCISPLLAGLLLVFIALAAGCSNGGGILPAGDTSAQAQLEATFTGGDNFVDLTGSGVTLCLADENGNPLPGVEVYLDGEPAAFSGEDGSYTLYGLTDEDSELSFAIDGQALFTSTINGATRAAAYADPDPNFERGKVFGIVTDIAGPVEHALVIVVQNDHFAFEWSGPEGGYVINDAPAGQGIILCFAKEHKPFMDGIVVFPDNPVQKDIFLDNAPAFAQLGGVVVDDHMWPVAHAKVTFIKPDKPPIVTFTNKFGVYCFLKLPVGPALVKVEAFGFHDSGGPVDLHPGKNIRHWQLERLPSGGIEGTVQGAGPDGALHPIPMAKVAFIKQIDPSQPPIVLERFTNDKGRYRFDFLPLGPCVLKAGKPGWLMQVRESFVAEGELRVEDFILEHDPNAPPPPPPPGDGGG